MFEFVIMFVKSLLVPLRTAPPTAAQIQAFEDYEDEHGWVTHTPSPTEIYEMDMEWVSEMRELPLWTLLRWRLAVAWMPFCKGGSERRLIGEWASRKLFPNLYSREAMRRRARGRRKVNA